MPARNLKKTSFYAWKQANAGVGWAKSRTTAKILSEGSTRPNRFSDKPAQWIRFAVHLAPEAHDLKNARSASRAS
jgi:hypothetical protein